MPEVLREIGALQRSTPGANASAADVAAWYEAKAAVHEYLAASCDDALERARETRFAAQARQHARALQATGEAA